MTDLRASIPPVAPEVKAAADAIALDRLGEAETRLCDWLNAHPRDVAALRLLGELAGRVGRAAEAEGLFREALEIAPNYLDARYALAVVLHRQMKAQQALAEAERLRAARPAEPLYRAVEAAVRASVGDHARSLELYEALFADDMDGPRLRLSYGHGLRTVGRAAESAATYRRLLNSSRPEDRALLGEAWWSLANLKTARLDEDDRARMRAALDDATTSDDGRTHLHYALGKALEDAGEADAAFAHYAAGAAIRRRRSRYDAAKTSTLVQRKIAAFTPELLAARGDKGASAPDPIFVVGLPRSGSTLVEQILASHPQVEGTMELGELPILAREAGIDGANGDPGRLSRLPYADLRRLGEAYLERTRIYRKSDRPLFIDKLPDNWLNVGLIRLILPNARIIDVRRAPLAACMSTFKQLFARGYAFSYGLDDLGRYYRDYVDMMDHLDAVAPGAVHRIVYEDLIDDAELQVRRLLDHIGLPFDPACLDFHRTERAVATPSAEQVRQPIYREGLDQWRGFEPHLGPLKIALGPGLEGWRGANR